MSNTNTNNKNITYYSAGWGGNGGRLEVNFPIQASGIAKLESNRDDGVDYEWALNNPLEALQNALSRNNASQYIIFAVEDDNPEQLKEAIEWARVNDKQDFWGLSEYYAPEADDESDDKESEE